MPALAFAADAMSDPEARSVCERASAALANLSEECEVAKGTKQAEDGKVMEAMKKSLGKDASKVPEDRLHVASMMCSVMQRQSSPRRTGRTSLTYIAAWVGKANATKAVAQLRVVCKEMVKFVPLWPRMTMTERSCATASSLLPTVPRSCFTTLLDETQERPQVWAVGWQRFW